MESKTTQVWEEYQQGVDYKTRIDLYNVVDRNERYYIGDQWRGIKSEGLPTPVLNVLGYGLKWKIAAVTDNRMAINYYCEGTGDGDLRTYSNQITQYADVLWERLGMDYLTKEGLKQAGITGDYIQYFYWDPSIQTGQALTGDINTQLIDNVNYYPANPNDPDVQNQEYIILAFRQHIKQVIAEARKNKISEDQIKLITSDEDTEYTSGDRGKYELEDSSKINVLLKLYKKDGKIHTIKSTRLVDIQPEKNTKLDMYPIALMNWETRKNCCHGEAEITHQIPNQTFINKILALQQLHQMMYSFPKVIYDGSRIKKWTNKVTEVVRVNGDVTGAASFMNPPQSNYDAVRGLDTTIAQTLKMMGANEVVLGNINNPDNTSAFLAIRDAALQPLEMHKQRFYAFVENVAMIWMDFIKNFYKAGRMIPIMSRDETGAEMTTYVPIPDDVLNQATMRVKIDVGPSPTWSRIQELQTLDNLLGTGKITLSQYLERVPDGHIQRKEELIQESRQMEQALMQPPQQAVF